MTARLDGHEAAIVEVLRRTLQSTPQRIMDILDSTTAARTAKAADWFSR